MIKKCDIIHTFVVLAYGESQYLEDCIKSVLNQRCKSNVIIATTTLNSHVKNLANKYKLEIVKGKHTNIGGDFDFAKNAVSSKLVTIAHQDDLYFPDYSKSVLESYKKYPDSSIIFSDYCEIRGKDLVSNNKNLLIKRFMLFPLRMKTISGFKFVKRLSIRFGDSICCPAVTFATDFVPDKIFESDLKCNIDWLAWEKLSKCKGKFIFINKKLMGHRISEDSTTSEIINKGIRTKEDLFIYKKFWPSFIAKTIAKFYRKSEDSNRI